MARDTAGNRGENVQQDRTAGASPSGHQGEQQQQRDQERAIGTTREEGRQSTGMSRRGQAQPVRGSQWGQSSVSPFSLMRRIAEDMDRIFQDFGMPTFGPRSVSLLDPLFEQDLWRGGSGLQQSAWSPQIETFRRGDKLVVRADLPGLKKEDVNIEIENDLLTVSGERSDQREEERDGFYRSERSYGEFRRSIALPAEVDPKQCEATFQDGVLEVALPLPKTQDRGAKRIQIR
jgi:HSP20 family protein